MENFSLFNQNVGDILSNPNTPYVGNNESLISGGPVFQDAPDVSGMSKVDATNLLLENGFAWSIFEIPTATEEIDGIVDSYYIDGVVYLNVYKYDSTLVVMLEVPNVVGMTEAQAITALTNAGFNHSSSTSSSGATSGNNGKIKSQSPAGGESAQEGSYVSIVKYNYVVLANSVNGNISGIRWAWHGDTSGYYAMFIRGTVFAGTVGSTISISGTSTGMDGNHTVVSITPDNSFDTGGTRIMVTRDSAATGISSTVTGTWALVS